MSILADPKVPEFLQNMRKVPCKVCGGPALVKKGKGNALKLCGKCRASHDAAKTARKKSAPVLRDMQAGIPGSPSPKIEVVRDAPSPAQNRASKPSHAQVAPKSFQAAVAIITEPLRTKGEGYRLIALGNTGAGKTVFTRAFLEATAGTALTLIHDDTKLEKQYNAPAVLNFSEAPDDADTVLFRGDAYAGTVVEVEPVAALGHRIAKVTRKPVRLVIDELDRACTLGGKQLTAPTLRVCMTQGRTMGISVVASTQAPWRMPPEIVDQASVIALCQLGPRALNYLDERLCFDKDFTDVVPTLKPLQFVLYENGKPWNGVIYESPLTVVAPAIRAPLSVVP